MKIMEMFAYKNTIKNTALIILFCMSQFSFAKGSTESMKSKTLEHSYNVDPNVILNIENKFGLIHIETWDQNQIDVEIEIIVYDKTEERAQERIDGIQIEISESSNQISLTTEMEEDWKNKVPLVGNTKNKVEVNYVVRMPKSGSLEIAHKYGDLFLDDIDGNVDIEMKYGNIKGESLNGNFTEMDLGYAKAEIEYIRNGDLEIKYSNLELEKSPKLQIESKYSNIEIEQVDEMDIDSKYGKVEIESVVNFEGEMRYTALEIDELLNELDLDIGYGPSCDINYIPAEFKAIEIEAQYTSVRLHFDPNSSFNLDADARYGNIKIDEEFSAGVEMDHETSGGKSINAIIGSGNPDNDVDVEISYGNLSIKSN